jgi:hypothetical protein
LIALVCMGRWLGNSPAARADSDAPTSSAMDNRTEGRDMADIAKSSKRMLYEITGQTDWNT